MSDDKLSFPLVVVRGSFSLCPNCGEGKIFKSYLKPVDNCQICKTELGSIRADDGPAWFTMIIVGCLLTPFIVITFPMINLPLWVTAIFWPSIAILLALLILPRAKGAFIGALWLLDKRKNN
ncbi:MAG: DUF983 domain-containing protein [Rickettsiales bacterium]